MTPARAERAALADLFDALGPDAPTLCAGWSTRDLAAHLVLREGRPDAAPGIVLGPLSGWTDRVQRGLGRMEWPKLVSRVRTGPPRWSAFALPGADQLLNTAEFFVHHEDVRRAQAHWEPRVADAHLDAALWSVLRSRARTLYRQAPVAVLLRRDTGEELEARGGEQHVVLTGPAPELVLHAFGRQAAARVVLEGDQAAVARLSAAQLGV